VIYDTLFHKSFPDYGISILNLDMCLQITAYNKFFRIFQRYVEILAVLGLFYMPLTSEMHNYSPHYRCSNWFKIKLLYQYIVRISVMEYYPPYLLTSVAS
jgi:hypothetical protein